MTAECTRSCTCRAAATEHITLVELCDEPHDPEKLVRPLPLAPAWRAHARRALAAAVLIFGYADLARGGVIVAPILLVTGYLLLVPLTLLRP